MTKTQGMGCDRFLRRTQARPDLGSHAHVHARHFFGGRTSHPHLCKLGFEAMAAILTYFLLMQCKASKKLKEKLKVFFFNDG